MSDTVKKQVAANAAASGAKKAAEAAKAATGWKKWLYGVLAVVLGAAAYFLSACGELTAEQVQAVHGMYHAVTGEPCIFGGGEK